MGERKKKDVLLELSIMIWLIASENISVKGDKVIIKNDILLAFVFIFISIFSILK